MTTLVWDKVGDRTYQAGLDRGVLYLSDGVSVVWNGLTSVEERISRETKAYFVDGVKYLEHQVPGDFAAQLKALTYPDEFEVVTGVAFRGNGLSVHDQPTKSFGLSYRTLIGDDVGDLRRGYKIHLLYNLLAVPDNHSYMSLGGQSSSVEFRWDLSATPNAFPGRKPTAHISIDSTKLTTAKLAQVEALIYGSVGKSPVLPSFSELVALLEGFTITLNGDGTWTATGPDEVVSMLSTTIFQLDGVGAVLVPTASYNIPTT